MMETNELLTDLRRLGVVVVATGGRLAIDAPSGTITPAIRAEIVRNKAGLLALLGGGPGAGQTITDENGRERTPAAHLDDRAPRLDALRDIPKAGATKENASGGADSSSEAILAAPKVVMAREIQKNPEVEPPWCGQRVRVDDLPAFKARWGLRTVGGDWPEEEPCPHLIMVEV
jgi:hypothetical protein